MERIFTGTIFKQILEDLNQRQNEVNYISDISDLGNELGLSVGKIYPNMNPIEIEELIIGIRHGISLTNGTH